MILLMQAREQAGKEASPTAGVVDSQSANLTRANLMSADLRGAKCSRLNIDSARLHFADCTESVDLKQEQINRALGNRDTKLPPGLDHPDNWDDE
jgi:uncharacterized protein YjbI with pentapeptide repeats